MRYALSIAIILMAGSAQAVPLIDVPQRTQSVAAFDDLRAVCAAQDLDIGTIPEPVSALQETEGYGSDQSVEGYNWAVMAYTGQALAGDEAATQALSDLLVRWATADALTGTPDIHDAHFALKRALLPTITAFGVVRGALPTDQAALVEAWIGGLVTKVDHTFDGDVDLNNHRYLADSVLAAWGAETGDAALLDKAQARLSEALLEQMRADGSFPLEARRGARAIWYHRQTLASLSVIIEALRRADRDPFADDAVAKAWDQSLGFFLDTLAQPRQVIRYAAENYIPGPEGDYRQQDLGFLDERGHGRHYMAWAELAVTFRTESLSTRRLAALMSREFTDERPLLDEFSAGPATCFWMEGSPI